MKAKIKFYLGVWISIFERNPNIRTFVLIICFLVYDYAKTDLLTKDANFQKEIENQKIELLGSIVKVMELDARCKELERDNQNLKSENEKIIQLLKSN